MKDKETLLRIKEICSVAKGQRPFTDVECMANAIRSLKVFENVLKTQGFQFLLQICQYLQIESMEANDYVFQYGEPGLKYYTILEGRVSICIPYHDSSAFTEIMTLDAGSSFGEAALEHDKPRGATVICLQASSFLILEKKEYVRFMQRMVSENKHKIVHFLQNLPIFRSVSRILLMKLTYNIKEISFKKGQTIFKEGDDVKNIFIIRHGECRICKYVTKEKSLKANIRQFVRLKICTAKTLGKGAIMGEEDGFTKTPHSYTCICNSDTVTLYMISAKEFFIRINGDDHAEIFKEHAREKMKNMDEWRNARESLEQMFSQKPGVKDGLKSMRETVKNARMDKEELLVTKTDRFLAQACTKIRVKSLGNERKADVCRNSSTSRLDSYMKGLDKSNSLTSLARINLRRSDEKRRKKNRCAVFSMNCLPIVEGIWSKKIEHAYQHARNHSEYYKD